MTNKKETVAQLPRLAEIVTNRMEERGISIDALAKTLDISYEHTRRIVRGISIPSRLVLKAVCEALKLPYKELLNLANADRITEKYGDLPALLSGKKPGMEPLERVWDQLDPQQQQDIIGMAQSWVKRKAS